MLIERVGALTIERNQLMKNLTKTGGMLKKMRNKIESLGYHHSLDEKVQSLALEIKKKDAALTYA